MLLGRLSFSADAVLTVAVLFGRTPSNLTGYLLYSGEKSAYSITVISKEDAMRLGGPAH